MRRALPFLSVCLLLATLIGCGTVRATEEAKAGRDELRYNAREGGILYQHYCSVCHGEKGEGSGFNAYNLDPKPRDLTGTQFQAERTDEDLESIIHMGGGAAGLSQAMPPWGRSLSGRQIRNIVAYIRALPTLVPDVESAEE